MPSFGEADIRVDGRHLGRLSLVGIRAAGAIFPRLIFDLGVQLQDSPGDFFEPGRPIHQFLLAECEGELRLKNDLIVAPFRWVGPRGAVRSANYPAQNRIEAVCDLDFARLRRIEEERGGGEAHFRGIVWASLRDSLGVLNATVDTLHITIPRDDWLRVLEGFQHSRYELVEIPYPGLEEPEFEAAVSHLHEAIAKLNKGEFDEAVGACRRAIEAMAATLNVGSKAPELQAALTPYTDDKRAEAYSGIIARLKALGNMTIHRRHAIGKFMRSEAQFTVATTAHALALVARLLRHPRADVG